MEIKSFQLGVIRAILGVAFLLTAIHTAPAQSVDAYTVPDTTGWTFYGSKSFMVGYDFTPSTAIQVTSLGVLDWTGSGLAGASQIGIWDTNGTSVVSAIIPSGGANPQPAGAPGAVFYFTNIPPVTLTAGVTYRIGNQMFGNNQPVVGWGGAFSAAPEITFGQGWGNNGSTFSEPVQFTNGTPYFGPVFQYEVAPTITTQPQSQTIISGSSAAFSVVAGGTFPFTYQWYFNGGPLSDGGSVSGSTSNILTITDAQTTDAGAYYVLVSDAFSSVTSSNAMLTVFAPVQITGQPTNEIVLVTSNVSFTVAATGSPLNFQWYFNNSPLSDGGHVTGSTSNILTIAGVQTNDAGAYHVVVSNDFSSATSSNATLTVLAPPQITGQPASQTVLLTSNTSFTVIATGPDLSYQWYFKGSPLSDGGRITGSASNTLNLANVQTDDNGSYQVLVSNSSGSVASSNAMLTVLVPPQITAPPANATVLLTSNASFTIIATGPALNYQWYFNGSPLSDGGSITGSTSNILTIADAQTNDAGVYQVIVSNENGSATSSNVTLTVLMPVQITGQPASEPVLLTSNASFTVTATGSALGYQWYFNGFPLTDNGRITGSGSPTLSISNIQSSDAGNYFVSVTNALTAGTSSNATLTVYAPVQITAQPVSLGVFAGNSASFSVTATGTALGYQWFFNGNALTDGGQITGSASPTLNISNVQGTNFGSYSVAVTNLLSATNSIAALLGAPSVRYVNVNSANPIRPFTDWSTAAAAIQDAIDISTNGDLILVTNGVYQTGGRIVYGSLTNRVVINKTVTVQSVNGPAVTIIQGYQQSNTIFGDAAVRCVYMTNGASLTGFTLTSGATRSSGVGNQEQSGGGVWCESIGSLISNCVITANTAFYQGGGAYQGTLLNCILSGNAVCSNYSSYGGGAFQSHLAQCTISGNSNNARFNAYGGAVCYGTVTNCAIAFNSCSGVTYAEGGGVYDDINPYSGYVANCVISSNSCSNLSPGGIASGGGVYGGTVVNSAIIDNACGRTFYYSANGYTGPVYGYGGGAYSSTLVNCTVAGNYASFEGGGTWAASQPNCIMQNCIVYFNSCPCPEGFDSTNTYPGFEWYCCTPTYLSVDGIVADPLLSSVYHLSTHSPCRGAGTGNAEYFNGPRVSGTDIDGEAWASPPSIGCDEIYPGNVTGEITVSIAPAFTNLAPGYAGGFQANISGPTAASVWNFGDGTLVTNEAFISHAWAAVGDYVVTLTGYNDTYPTGQVAALTIHVSVPTTSYVDMNCPTPIPPYSYWSTAANNIQDAVDAAAPGSLVLVTNGNAFLYHGDENSTQAWVGVYQLGGRAVYGVSNRVAITKPITVESVNGPQYTFISGAGISRNVRGVYMTNGAALIGFTVTNAAANYGDPVKGESGGGIWSESTNDIITNCVIARCFAGYGGGVYSGTFYNCLIFGNGVALYQDSQSGGGADSSVLYNCTLAGNAAYTGGGAASSTLSNCSISNNTGSGTYLSALTGCLLAGNSSSYGGGALGGSLTNCTLVGNWAQYGGGAFGGTISGSGTFPAILNNCLIASNRAGFGGGACGGSVSYGGTPYSGRPTTNCILNECLITANIATNQGGGTELAALNACMVTSNTMASLYPSGFSGYGGGAEGGILTNCIIAHNSAFVGGGVDGYQVGDLNCLLFNCTIADNDTTNYGSSRSLSGGVSYCHLYNCIDYNNTLISNNIIYSANGNNFTMNYCCTIPLLVSGPGNFTNAPLFVDLAGGDFHLQSNSPCINAGDNSYVTTATDLDGNPRIVGGTVDIGAYEYQTPTSILSYAWAQQYGLPTDGSMDYLDMDGTGLPNWQKSIAGLNPTNPASILAMLPLAATNNATGVAVTWQSVNTRLYYLQRATDLTAQPPFSALQSNLVGQAGTTTFTDTTATNSGPYFYRVGVQ